ncbi:MAG TPA: hypothetical protein VGQ76_12010 [Thermoanaerobaculia bacterium]|nr:hypothetical protein [Thermoanaerobaculia bacterium]
MIIVATSTTVSRGVIAQRHPSIRDLDALMKRFWIAAVTGDTTALNSTIVGEQPRVVLGMFIGSVTRADAERVSTRRRPPMRSLGDTVWRTYAVRQGDIPRGWLHYVARFERRCGRWRIAAISSVERPR